MKRESGLTMIELVITLMLTSVFALLVGFIVVSANEWWIKSCKNLTLQDNMRYARRRLSWLLCNADKNPFNLVDPAKPSTLVVKEGQCMTFNGNERITLETASDGKKRVVHIDSTGNKEIILTDVDTFWIHDVYWLEMHGYEMQMGNTTEKSVVQFAVDASIPATNDPAGARITSSAEWLIKNRNSGT